MGRNLLMMLAPLVLAGAAPAPYRAERGGPPPDELAAVIREALGERGARVVDSRGFRFCELWLREAPLEETSMEDAFRQWAIPEGALLGVIEFQAPSADRSGRGFPRGLYTLRYAGGDSVVLIPASADQALEPSEDFTSRSKGVLRWTRGTPGVTPRFEMNRRGEWILHASAGEVPVAVLVTGVAAR